MILTPAINIRRFYTINNLSGSVFIHILQFRGVAVENFFSFS